MPVDHRDRTLDRLLLALLPAAFWLSGCGSAPQVRALGARPIVIAGAQGAPDAAGYRIELEVRNPSKDDMPLERFQYTFMVKDVGRFEGRWAAFRTLPPGESAVMILPASTLLPVDLPERVDLDGDIDWWIEGGVRYQAPGLVGQILFDAGVRRPTQSFSGSGTFQIDRPASPEPVGEEYSREGPETASAPESTVGPSS